MLEITIGEVRISSQRALKHLGVMVDDRLSFNAHVDYACEKAAKAVNTVARIMPNVGGSRSSKSCLLANVATSILRYGMPAWATALKTKRNRAKLNRVFRLMAMRVVSAYRTIWPEAVCVIAWMMPVNIILEEDVECYRRRNTRNEKAAARTDSLAKWKQQWDKAVNGRWTHRLIPNVSAWVDRKHGEWAHVAFECPRIAEIRRDMRGVTVDNIVEEICCDEDTWNVVDRAVNRVGMIRNNTYWSAEQQAAATTLR
ncbi:uncharacterized protein LOC131439391 [Malaya genurostris]|uniref:uncharacterized protein LOC131439391 n=1 Tax=Malaya genurostris TaxID=325434 RepID=UPI0026F3CAE4|nr:uncharacterized protein LOC131439391 [Malaya genurostris]